MDIEDRFHAMIPVVINLQYLALNVNELHKDNGRSDENYKDKRYDLVREYVQENA